MELATVNIIVGPNEAGKSSIRDAIQWCLTGQARGLKTHQEQSALIRNGGKAAEVTITLENGQTIARRKTPKSPATLSGEIPENGLSTAILCDPHTFLSLTENQRRELLFRLVPGLNPTAEEVSNRLLNRVHPGQEKITDISQAEFKAINIIGELTASKGFKEAETEAVSRRREAKRLRESLGQAREPDPNVTIGDRLYILPDVNREDVVNGIKDLQHQRDVLIKSRGRQEADKARAAAIEIELDNLKANLFEPPREAEIEKLQGEVDSLKTEKTDIEAALKASKAPETFPAICPAILSEQTPCPRSGDTVGGQFDPARIAELEESLAKYQEVLTQVEQDLRDATARIANHKRLSEQIAKLEKELTDFQAGGGQETPADLEDQIAVLAKRIENGHSLLGEVQNFWNEKNRYDEAQEQLSAAEQEIVLYDALAKALAPDGIPSKMIAEALGPVNKLLESAANHLFPDRSLTLTKDLGIELSGSPYTTLSKSAKFRVGIACQFALAKLAGARLLMIDEADMLDPKNRMTLLQFLTAIRPDFDTILVFATSDKAFPFPNAQVWWLEHGKISSV